MALFFLGMQFEYPDALPFARAGEPAPALPAVEPLGDKPGFDAAALRAGGVKLVH